MIATGWLRPVGWLLALIQPLAKMLVAAGEVSLVLG